MICFLEKVWNFDSRVDDFDSSKGLELFGQELSLCWLRRLSKPCNLCSMEHTEKLDSQVLPFQTFSIFFENFSNLKAADELGLEAHGQFFAIGRLRPLRREMTVAEVYTRDRRGAPIPDRFVVKEVHRVLNDQAWKQ